VLGAVAEFDRSVLVAKLKAARMRKRKATGRCEGCKPYGKGPGEAEVLALIRRLRRRPRGGRRLSYDAIAARLNLDGVRSRTRRPWAGPTVHGILGHEPCA
jgi:DNA invertase Pin-like site-specific DNA recombinase